MAGKTGKAHPALEKLKGDSLSVADMTRRVQEQAANPTPAPGLPPVGNVGRAQALVPRTIEFSVDYDNPDTGAIEHFTLISTVPDGAEVATMARMAVSFAQVPLDMLAAGDRQYFVDLGRAFVQLREIPDRVRELLLDPEFLAPVCGRLAEHEARFRLRGRSPGDLSTAEPAIRLSPWDAA